MKNISSRIAAGAALLGMAAILSAAVLPDLMPFHERKEVAGLAIVFGAEPEPALTDEIQMLAWRVSSLASEEPYTELTEASVTVTRNGQSYGPFDLRPVRGTPGRYQTRHIFTEVGEYGTVMTFKKDENSEVHSVDFNFNINDRADLEIPKKRGGGR